MRTAVTVLALTFPAHFAFGLVLDSQNENDKAETDSVVIATSATASGLGTIPHELRQYVGRIGMGSGVYLGNGYVLTSAHVGCYPFQSEDGTIYRPDYSTWDVLSSENGESSDLAIFKIEFPHGDNALSLLQPLPVASQSPREEAPVVLIGTGLQQQAEPATIKSGEKVLAVLGYRVDHSRKSQLGTNHVDEVMADPIRSKTGVTHCFTTRFDRYKEDAQASDGDSGGASFAYNKDLNRWELAGCIVAVTQKDGFIPFGSQTFLADLSRYRHQIPEENFTPLLVSSEEPQPVEFIHSELESSEADEMEL